MTTITAITLGATLSAAALVGVVQPASAAQPDGYAMTVTSISPSAVTVDVSTTGGVKLRSGGSTGAELADAGSDFGSIELPSTAELGGGAIAAGTWRVIDGHTAVFTYSVTDASRTVGDAAWGHCVSGNGVGGAAAGAFAGAFTGPGIIAGAALGSMTGLIAGAITCS